MSDKPCFEIDLEQDAQSALAAHSILEIIDNCATHHTKHNLRPALGIYNVSTLRVLQKVEDLSTSLEQYMRLSPESLDHHARSRAERSLIDYIELSIYAAAEHVDDIELIAKHFYRSEQERKRCPHYRILNKEIKQQKLFISALANYIKHSQHRIRLFHLAYKHSGQSGVFYGYIIESVTDGVVGPSPIFHSKDRSVFSVTSLAWEVISFVLRSSRSLEAFLKTKKLASGPVKTKSEHLTNAIIAAARLPLYNLDDDHPFSTSTLHIKWDEASWQRASSLLYGSSSNPWAPSDKITFGQSGAAFAGDGITRSFKMLVSPSRVGLQHWQQA
jgi:hypothetical protein